MATRLEFHNKLLTICDHVYYQQPENFKMTYPCIVYDLNRDQLLHADDFAYVRKKQYSVTIIDRDPDSTLPDRFSEAFNAGMERHYTADNLHHFSYTIVQ